MILASQCQSHCSYLLLVSSSLPAGLVDEKCLRDGRKLLESCSRGVVRSGLNLAQISTTLHVPLPWEPGYTARKSSS